MVAFSVRIIGQRPVECSARLLLFKAQTALERSAWIECGCQLREAARLYLLAECQYHDCVPKAKKTVPPRYLAQALLKARVLGKDTHGWIIEIIEMGNKTAHLAFVKPGLLAAGISTLHLFLDDSPYLVQPKAGGRV